MDPAAVISKDNPIYKEVDEEEPPSQNGAAAPASMEIHASHIQGRRHHAPKSVTIGAGKAAQESLVLDTRAAMTGTSATFKFSDDMTGHGSLFDNPDSKVASGPNQTPVSFMPVKASDDKVNSCEMSRMNEKVARMEQPTAKAKNYLSLTQFTIILSILCCFWPYNIFCLFGVYILSKMVADRNDERDYLSARSASWITLVCNLTALIFGGIVTLTIFLVVFVYVVIAIKDNAESSSSTTTNNDDLFRPRPRPPFYYDYNNY